jgi:hypothetical protein
MSKAFENIAICAECGGRCCKTMPGACFPDDFNVSEGFGKLDKSLESGKYCIDWRKNDPREKQEYLRGYYVRPAIKGREGVLFHPSQWGGVCTFWTDTGCVLEIEDRPQNCRMLEPKEDERCVLHGKSNKQDAVIAWLEYYEYFEKRRREND